MDSVLVDGRHTMHIHDCSLIAKIPSLTVTNTAVTSGSADTTRPLIIRDNTTRRCVSSRKAQQRSDSGMEWAWA